MDLEENEARNDCGGEGQQQLNRPTDWWAFTELTEDFSLLGCDAV
jgi:hypothetical protein